MADLHILNRHSQTTVSLRKIGERIFILFQATTQAQNNDRICTQSSCQIGLDDIVAIADGMEDGSVAATVVYSFRSDQHQYNCSNYLSNIFCLCLCSLTPPDNDNNSNSSSN